MQFNTYLNFDGNAHEAFLFYNETLKGEMFHQKMGEAPGSENLAPGEEERAMHVALIFGNGQCLMASDCLPSMGQKLQIGNNVYVNLAVDSRAEAERIFEGLSRGGAVEMPMADMFWGDYFGSFKDKYGVQWMITYKAK